MREYVAKLQAREQVRVVEREVDPRFELAAVTQRSQRESDRAILFRQVRGTAFPVVTNLYGSRRRLCELIGAADGRFCRRWTALAEGGQAFEATTPAKAPDLREGRPGDLPQITYCERDAR
jgi:UbiD family decarboxylase